MVKRVRKTVAAPRRQPAASKARLRPAAPPAPAYSFAAQPELRTLLDHVRFAVSRFQEAGVVVAHGTGDPVAEAAFIVGEALRLHPDQFETFAGAAVTASEQARILALVAARIETRKPAAYLLNKIYQRGLPFYVDERAIVPRSYLGEALEQHFSGGEGALIEEPNEVVRVLDLCTGSGCLAILAARAFPHARIDAVDISADALAVAARNVADHGLGDRIRLLRGDLFAPLAGEVYDLILSNPPYVDAEGMAALPPECRHEPAMAFDGGVDGIAIVRRILDAAPAHLAPGGGLLCEIGRCRAALETAYPGLPFLWLDSEESEGEVFWLDGAAE
jgi:ribosomal protein L3 glutamine methyltransferase